MHDMKICFVLYLAYRCVVEISVGEIFFFGTYVLEYLWHVSRITALLTKNFIFCIRFLLKMLKQSLKVIISLSFFTNLSVVWAALKVHVLN
uniref:Uncharacterized protein n=1 Tax=Rhizophora mucronata TaxID=61149 RepID=A0A2P2P564_RHIMU